MSGAGERLGSPRVHFRRLDSTNARGRTLAARGVPHGTVITAAEQSAGRGRQGRRWLAAPGRALLCSVVLRDPPALLPLIAGVAVAEVVGPAAMVKWPNDVLLPAGKVCGILVEGRPQERWAVGGIGLNVALRESEIPRELRGIAATMGLDPAAIEPTLARLLVALERWLRASGREVLEAVRARDALLGRPVRWDQGQGHGAGIDEAGRLLVATASGQVALDAGEVHLVH